ncbi:Diaminopimelate epimerase-like protein [Lojkania enalia]|uniref:Diaminopimelate epimerase-like protein n=1 Tax=Lojkania enalia TaxID=147567 RepID=A0A9P4NBH6_9PLEO|nr:Diaminopimelate epimerase-like protein [Didymosphaeria enalia]
MASYIKPSRLAQNWKVYVFTKTRNSGNPLAIVRVPTHVRPQLTEKQKLDIAIEFTFSETIFLHTPQDGIADYDIFTPRAHVSFAGHPTIGLACYISQHAEWAGIKKLRTLAGIVDFEYDSGLGVAEVKIPHDVRIHEKRLAHPLPGKSMNPVQEDTVPIVSIVKGMAFNLVPLASLEALGSVSKGLIPYSKIFAAEYLDKGSGYDVGLHGTFYYVDLGLDSDDANGKRRLLRTRSIGSVEDPGTGSASSALCCYLALQEGKGRGKGPFEFHLVQGVEMGRRCDIFVRVLKREGGRGIEGVWLSGAAVEVMETVVTV